MDSLTQHMSKIFGYCRHKFCTTKESSQNHFILTTFFFWQCRIAFLELLIPVNHRFCHKIPQQNLWCSEKLAVPCGKSDSVSFITYPDTVSSEVNSSVISFIRCVILPAKNEFSRIVVHNWEICLRNHFPRPDKSNSSSRMVLYVDWKQMYHFFS